MKNDYDMVFYKKMNELKVPCKHCGHKEIFTTRSDRKICSWCHNYVYKNNYVEFKYKLKENIGKVKYESKCI